MAEGFWEQGLDARGVAAGEDHLQAVAFLEPVEGEGLAGGVGQGQIDDGEVDRIGGPVLAGGFGGGGATGRESEPLAVPRQQGGESRIVLNNQDGAGIGGYHREIGMELGDHMMPPATRVPLKFRFRPAAKAETRRSTEALSCKVRVIR